MNRFERLRMEGREIKTDKNGCVVKVERLDEAAECSQVVHSAVSFTFRPHLPFCRIYIQSTQLYISFIANWRSMSVCICAQMSYFVRCIRVLCKGVFCMCMYVSVCVVRAHFYSYKVLLCVAALLLLP